jgi:hypothetical protein
MNFTDINEPNATQVVDASCLKYEFFDQLLYNSKFILDDGIITNINTVKTNSTHRIIMQIKNAISSSACNTVSNHAIPFAASSRKDNINTWCISNHKYHDNLIRDIDAFGSGTVLLDLTKNKYTLIEKIHIAPNSPKWFAELVNEVVNSFGYKFEIIQSQLNNYPHF